MDISKHEVLTDLYKLGLNIEELGCSTELTNVMVKLGEISEKVNELIDTTGTGPVKIKTIKQLRNDMVINYLRIFDGHRTHTAKAMGVSIRSLRNYITEMRSEGIFVPEAGMGNQNNRLGNSGQVDNSHNYKMPTNKERLKMADNPERSLYKT